MKSFARGVGRGYRYVMGGVVVTVALQLPGAFVQPALAGSSVATAPGSGPDTLSDDGVDYTRDNRYINAGFMHGGDLCAKTKKAKGEVSALTYGPDSYSYSVTGSGCGHKVVGVIDVDGVDGVSGYLYLENGAEVKFIGDWVADGVAEGMDEHGNLYTVRVDK